MYPLKDWHSLKRGYKFREKTWYSKYHLGLDLICKKGTPIFAPFDGKVKTMIGKQGGKTIWFYWDDKIMRVLHLSSFGKYGVVEKGDIIGYVGNTGSLSRGDHAHLDISKHKVDIYDINNFIDPELFFNNENMDYVKSENGEQYLLDDTLKIALNIGDEEELIVLQKRGLSKQPKNVSNSYLNNYLIYPLVRKSRWAKIIKTLRDLSGF